MKRSDIARVCHEVNRTYCRLLGDYTQIAWENAPEWQKRSALLGVNLHLSNTDSTPADSHESWVKEKVADGWKWGEVKCEENKTHPCIVKFSELSVEQRAKDYIFCGIVHALAKHVEEENVTDEAVRTDEMLKWFDYAHLPGCLQVVSKPFGQLANIIVQNVAPGNERTVALRKLLEAKDAAVRARLKPGS